MRLAIFQGFMAPVTPENFDSTPGVYGSELAYIKLIQGIQKFKPDWNITVFGTYKGHYTENGIEYINFNHFYETTESEELYDAMIVSRYVFNFILQDYRKVAKKYFFWAHDNSPLYWVNGGNWRSDLHDILFDEPFVRNKDGYVVCFSEYHKELYHEKFNVPYESIKLIGHGTDFETPNEVPKRDPYRFMYSSSLDRGVDNALKLFTRIHKVYPQSSFHVFYGCKDEALIKAVTETPGVVYHGKVPSGDVPYEYCKSNYWLYPTEFYETFGITSIEAQYGGAIPLTSGVAALSCNVADRGLLLGPVEQTEEWYDSKAEEILELMNDKEKQNEMRRVCQEWAKGITWDRSTLKWIEVLE